jgi:hypothetical protein
VIAPGRVGVIWMFWGKHPEAGLRGNIRLIRRDRARICLRPDKTSSSRMCRPTIVGTCPPRRPGEAGFRGLQSTSGNGP